MNAFASLPWSPSDDPPSVSAHGLQLLKKAMKAELCCRTRKAVRHKTYAVQFYVLSAYAIAFFAFLPIAYEAILFGEICFCLYCARRCENALRREQHDIELLQAVYMASLACIQVEETRSC